MHSTDTISPRMKRSHSLDSIWDTYSKTSVGVPRIILNDIKHMSYVKSSDSHSGIKIAVHSGN